MGAFLAVLGMVFIIYLTFTFWWEIAKWIYGCFKNRDSYKDDIKAHKARMQKYEERRARFDKRYPPPDTEG